MKNIILFLVCIFLSVPLFSSEKQIVINLNDGTKKVYKLSNIESMDINKSSNNNLMKIFLQNSEAAYFPVNSLDSIRFQQLNGSSDSMIVYVFGCPRMFPVDQIDSITINKLETKIKEGVIVFDTTNSKDIISLDTNSINLSAASSLLNDIKVGSILAAQPTSQAPSGFLRRVLSIVPGQNSSVLTTENANITDVVESGIVSFSRDFSPADTGNNFIDMKGNQIQSTGFTVGFADIVIFDFDKNPSTTNDQIKIDGTDTFNPTIKFNLVIERWKLKQVLVQLSVQNHLELTAHANLTLEKSIQKSLNELLGIPKIKLPNITIWLGWVPFVITSNIDVQVGCELSLGAEVSSGISTDAFASAGVEYNSGSIKPIANFSSSFDFNPPELSITGSVKGFVGPQINVSFYNLPQAFQAYAGVFGFLELEVSLLSKPLWQLSAGVEASAGVSSEWFNFDYTLPISLEYRKLLAQANNLIDKIDPLKGKIGDVVTITGSGFGDTRGTNYVAFSKSNSLTSKIIATDYPEWTDEEIQVKIPNGLTPGAGKLLLNVGGYLSNTSDFTIITDPVISSINPTTAAVGDLVIINGSNFGSSRQSSVVTFSGINATTYDSWTNTSIKVRVPQNATSGKLYVTVNELKSNELDFTLKPSAPIADTVIIGTQVWMTKNLDVVTYRNGNRIPQVQDPSQWKNLNTGAWCYYNNDSTTGKTYGKLYNWYAVNDSRGLAPIGWHIPKDADWTLLETFLGGATLAGGKMKETGFNHWMSPNTGATNESGFYALPSGSRNAKNGQFSGFGTNCFFWSSSEPSTSTNVGYKTINSSSGQIMSLESSKASGYSIRCLRDIP